MKSSLKIILLFSGVLLNFSIRIFALLSNLFSMLLSKIIHIITITFKIASGINVLNLFTFDGL